MTKVVRTLLVVSCAMVWPLSLAVAVAPVGIVDLTGLTRAADLVVVGEAANVKPISASARADADAMTCDIVVDQVLKGEGAKSVVPVVFPGPKSVFGYRGVSDGAYAIYFLRKAGAQWTFVSPFDPSVVAIRGSHTDATSAEDAVSDLVGDVLLDSRATPPEVSAALYAFTGGTRNRVGISKLRAVLSRTGIDDHVRYAVLGLLLESNDAVALPIAVDALVHHRDLAPAILASLRAGIERGTWSDMSVGDLSVLLADGDSANRRAAASGVAGVPSPAAANAIRSALNDSDESVQYAVVHKLGQVTQDPKWLVTPQAFHADRNKYLDHWRAWVAEAH